MTIFKAGLEFTRCVSVMGSVCVCSRPLPFFALLSLSALFGFEAKHNQRASPSLQLDTNSQTGQNVYHFRDSFEQVSPLLAFTYSPLRENTCGHHTISRSFAALLLRPAVIVPAFQQHCLSTVAGGTVEKISEPATIAPRGSVFHIFTCLLCHVCRLLSAVCCAVRVWLWGRAQPCMRGCVCSTTIVL